jgi:hypothetical protein
VSFIKSRILQHFYTRKRHFIIGKPSLTIYQDKDRFDLIAEWKDGAPHFKVDHGVAHIYFNDIDNVVEFVEKHKESKC